MDIIENIYNKPNKVESVKKKNEIKINFIQLAQF